MPYIVRDENGKIVKVSARQTHGMDLLPHNHPDVTEFLKIHGQNPETVDEILAELRRTDGEMARAVEDVIMVLLKKNMIKMTEMPKAVQERMALRLKLRTMLQDIYDQASGTKVL